MYLFASQNICTKLPKLPKFLNDINLTCPNSSAPWLKPVNLTDPLGKKLSKLILAISFKVL